MPRKVKLLVGSKKGVFIFESDVRRQSWRVAGPFCENWPIHHAVGDPRDGAIYGAGGNEWFGPAVWKSSDGGAHWTHSSAGLAYAACETPIKAAWSVAPAHGRLYVGVEPAGLFVSDDCGARFEAVKGLRDHPTRPDWQPGGAGLILHSIVLDPDDSQRIWVAISAAGVFYSGDGGATWVPRNKGTRVDFAPDDQRYPEFGQCVHCLVKAPGRGDRLYQQNHCGMYCSDDGGENWVSVEKGLPSTFGFPAAAHPRDPEALFLFPLNGAEQGRFAPDGRPVVWKTTDGGAHWRGRSEGLPQGDAYFGVLRQAMATDALEPAGVYFGAGNGAVYASADEGETWTRIAENLPAISSVETLVTDA
jgi:photosystem II stability/assembly factor-like uncharacterized protein